MRLFLKKVFRVKTKDLDRNTRFWVVFSQGVLLMFTVRLVLRVTFALRTVFAKNSGILKTRSPEFRFLFEINFIYILRIVNG